MKQEVPLMSLLVAISIWATLLIVPAAAAVSAWDLTSQDISSYTRFITSLRSDAKDSKLVYFGIPMLPAAVKTLKPKFLIADLRGEDGTIRLAINRSNLYLLGYADRVMESGKEKERALFFRDAPEDAKKDLFPNAIQPKQGIPCKTTYSEIESLAGVKEIMNFGLGIEKLNSRVKKVYGKDVQKNQGEMLLMAVQMVSEAARFKYVENQVKWLENKSDFRSRRLAVKWDKLSTEIRKADKNGKLKESVDLVKPNNTPDPVNSVNQVKDDIAILTYIA